MTESTKPVLYLMIGFPGSGKTTTAHLLHDLTGAEHIWADKERQQMFGTPTHAKSESDALYRVLNARTEEILQAGKSVIFDTNFSFRSDRDYLRTIASRAGAGVVVLWVCVSTELARERATHNHHADRNGYDHIMAVETFDRIVSHLQPPTEDESPIKLDGTQITADYLRAQLHLQ